MKLWQLKSLLRSYPNILKRTFEMDEWANYASLYANHDVLVNTQYRTKLDAELPNALVIHALEQADISVFLSGDKILSSRRYRTDHEMSIAKAVRKYGDEVIEDVFEYGSVKL